MPGASGEPESEVSLLAIRERALESGVHELGDAELLTLLLGTGSSGHPGGVRGLIAARGGRRHRRHRAFGAACVRGAARGRARESHALGRRDEAGASS